jgi:hypothetical protein
MSHTLKEGLLLLREREELLVRTIRNHLHFKITINREVDLYILDRINIIKVLVRLDHIEEMEQDPLLEARGLVYIKNQYLGRGRA